MTLPSFKLFRNLCLFTFALSTPVQAQDVPVPEFTIQDPLQLVEPASPTAPTQDGFYDSWFAETPEDGTPALQPQFQQLNAPFDVKTAAIAALRNGQHTTAESLFLQANRDGHGQLATYGLALLATQKGDYETALKTISPLAQQDSNYATAAQDLRAELLLLLTQQEQIRGKYSAAKPWLELYQKDYANKHPERFKQIAFAQGWQLDLDHKDDRYPFLRVGVLLPMSGPLAQVGKDLLRAAQLALFENDSQRILLYPEDTQGTPEGTQAAIERLDKLGVDAFIGPLLAQNVDAATPFAKSNNMPILALSSDAKVANNNVFLMSYLPGDQALLAAQYAVRQQKYSLATLTPDDDYGLKVTNIFRNEAENIAVSLTEPVVYSAESADLTRQLSQLLKLDEAQKLLDEERKLLEAEFLMVGEAMDDISLARLRDIKDAKPEPIIEFDALFVPASAQSMPLVASQLAFYDIDPRNTLLLGTARWFDKAILQNRGEYLRGARMVAPAKGQQHSFENSFSKAYGDAPQPLSLLIYDAVKVLHQLTKTQPNQSRAILHALQEGPVFYGLGGGVRFMENGVNRRSYDIAEITSKGFKRVEMGPLLPPPPLPETIDLGAKKEGGGLFNFWD